MREQIAARWHSALEAAAAAQGLQRADRAVQLATHLGVRGYVLRHAGGRVAGGKDGGTASRAQRLMPQLQATVLREAAVEISRTLAEDGIRHFFFKGIALLGRAYQPGDRELADIDLVVHPKDRSSAIASLHTLGYVDRSDREQSGPAALRPGVTMHRPDRAPRVADILLDVHWGLEPVDRLLPRAHLLVPPPVWAGVHEQHGLPVPLDEHHLALLVHHLVHHDLLHLRGVLDVAQVWARLPRDAGRELTQLATVLGVRRATRAVARVMVRDFNLPPLRGVPIGLDDGWRARRLEPRLRLDEWIVWVGRVEPAEHVMLTPHRVWRRVLIADDIRTAAHLLRDAVAPPKEFLRWRWPTARSDGAAWLRHVRGLAGKVLRA